MQILEFQPYAEHVRQVWRWWSRIALDSGRPPLRSEVDPSDFQPALSEVWLVEWLAEEDTFRYRLAGESINRTHGLSLKGKTIQEIFAAPSRTRVDAAWRQVLGLPAVAYQAGRIYEDSQTTRQGERLTLPLLSEAGGPATFILGVTSHPKGLAEDEVDNLSLLPNHNHVFFPLKDLLAKKA